MGKPTVKIIVKLQALRMVQHRTSYSELRHKHAFSAVLTQVVSYRQTSVYPDQNLLITNPPIISGGPHDLDAAITPG